MSDDQYERLRSEIMSAKALVMLACSVACDYVSLKVAFLACAVGMMALSWRRWPR